MRREDRRPIKNGASIIPLSSFSSLLYLSSFTSNYMARQRTAEEEEEASTSEASASEASTSTASEEESDDEPSPSNNDSALVESSAFALPDLVSFNTHQINPAELYSATSENRGACTIDSSLPINEELLLRKAVTGASQLLTELWRLDSERKDGGLMVARLPSRSKQDGYVLPRMLPPPPQKQLTKWEKFALERGISPKSKRSRKQFDEATGEWKHLTGPNKANAGPESWPILEVKKNDDPHQDPWEKLKEEKKQRINKNTTNRMKNAESHGLLEKGSANKMTKQLQKNQKQRLLSREHEKKQGIIAPVGVPTDMLKSTDGKRGKHSIALALQATQVSTASLGKFDKMREGEPERKLEKSTKKRKTLMDDNNGKKSTNEEQKARDILSKVMNGSKEKERDAKKGKLAYGETAYDYEYDDGLGAGSFRKKKGRAGIGKMRKITKKRIK